MNKTKHNSGTVHRTAQQWSLVLEQYRHSGLTQTAFCETQGLAISSFTSALRRSRKSDVETARTDAFVPVVLDGVAHRTPLAAWDVELTLGAGIVLRIRSV
jgi:hypothetical protein